MNMAELSQVLNVFTAGLSEKERQVFLWRYWYLDSIEKICRDFHFSTSKVKSMLYRTRTNLMAHLQGGV